MTTAIGINPDTVIRDLIVAYVERAGLTVCEFAAVIGVDESTVRGWLRLDAPTSFRLAWFLRYADRFPIDLRESIILVIAGRHFTVTRVEAAIVAPAGSIIGELIEVDGTVATALQNAARHDADGVWTRDELIATGRDIAGIVRSAAEVAALVAHKVAGAFRQLMPWGTR